MNGVISSEKELLMAVQKVDHSFFDIPSRSPYYTIIFLTEGSGTYIVDISSFSFYGPVLLFSTPLQRLAFIPNHELKGYVIRFHSDFYCIEYHKARIACNGLLFNNIYIEPSVVLTHEIATIFETLCTDIFKEFQVDRPDETVLRSYLQLFLAKSSNIKLKAMASREAEKVKDRQMETFMKMLEENFLTLHKPGDYAKQLAMSPNTLTKRCQRYFGKSPSAMIQERLILEAKKKLHLTRQSIKEIAFSLNFSDEFYFSRFFKKFTKVSPKGFRDSVGISIIADPDI